MKRFKTFIEQVKGETCSCCDNEIDKNGKCGCGPDCEHCGGQHDMSEAAPKINKGKAKGSISATGLRGKGMKKFDVNVAVQNGKFEFRITDETGRFQTVGIKQAAKMLGESTVDNLVNEAVGTEQLDELSPATLKSYKKKAIKQYKQSANKRMPGGGDYGSATKKAQDKHQKRFDKRHKGIGSEIKRTTDSDIHLKDPKGLVRKDPKSNSMTGKPAPYKHKAESLDDDFVNEAVGTSAKHAGKTGMFGGKYTSKDHMIGMKNFTKIRDKKHKQRDAEHAKQDPKMRKMGYAKHMLDTDKADAKARKRGIDPTGKYDKYKKKNGIREELDEATINAITAEYINENNITLDQLENMTEAELNELIGKALGGAFKLGAKAAVGAGRLAKRAVVNKQGNIRGTQAAKQDKAGDRAEKEAKKREAEYNRKKRIQDAEKRARDLDKKISSMKSDK